MANEKRLISVLDATKIYNGVALYIAENAYLNDTALDVLKMVVSWLDEVPTVDAVEVVRCKDCKHWEAETGFCVEHSQYNYDEMFWDVFNEDDFCSYGERKDNE